MTNIQAPGGDERAPERPVFADRQLAEFIASMSAGPPMSASGDVVELRRATAERVRLRPAGPEMATIDVSLANGRCRARLYRPDGRSGAVVVYLHGGGWTIGGVDTHDRACRRLADRSRLSFSPLTTACRRNILFPRRSMTPSLHSNGFRHAPTSSVKVRISSPSSVTVPVAPLQPSRRFGFAIRNSLPIC